MCTGDIIHPVFPGHILIKRIRPEAKSEIYHTKDDARRA